MYNYTCDCTCNVNVCTSMYFLVKFSSTAFHEEYHITNGNERVREGKHLLYFMCKQFLKYTHLVKSTIAVQNLHVHVYKIVMCCMFVLHVFLVKCVSHYSTPTLLLILFYRPTLLHLLSQSLMNAVHCILL